jgi:hypothetical protein
VAACERLYLTGSHGLHITTHALPDRCLRYTFHIAAVFSRLYSSAMAAATPDGEAGVLRKRRSAATGPSAVQPLQPKVEGNDVARPAEHLALVSCSVITC